MINKTSETRSYEPEKEAQDVPLPVSDDNTCVLCGCVVPEGRLVCPRCEFEAGAGHAPQ